MSCVPADEEKKRARRQAVHQLSTIAVGSFVGKVVIWAVCLVVVAVPLIVFHVLEPGSAADWLAALGAIFAASAALNIATKDRSERRQEREAASLAQMRLVRIQVSDYADSDYTDRQVRVDVTNYGERPILDVRIVSVEVESRAAGVFTSSGATSPSELEIVPTIGQPSLPTTMYAGMTNSEGSRWDPRRNEDHLRKYSNGLNVTLQCIDADGQHWLLSINGDPQRQVAQSNPHWLLRLWKHREEAGRELWELVAPSRKTTAAVLLVGLVVMVVWIGSSGMVR